MLPYKVYSQIALGPITIYTWGLLASVAFIAAMIVALKEAKRKKIDENKVLNLAIFIIIGAFLGARILYVAISWSYYQDNLLEIPMIWEGGWVFYGGVFGALFFGWLYIKKSGLCFWKIADLVAPSVAIGIFFGRIGCSLINDHIGSLTNLPWGIYYIDGTVRHPVAEYLSLNGLAIFIFLWSVRKRIKTDGLLFIIFLLWYSFVRFFLDFTRCYDLYICDPHFYGWTVSQWISIGVFGVSLAFFCHLIKKSHLIKKVLRWF